MATNAPEQTLFVRKASGLVKGWSEWGRLPLLVLLGQPVPRDLVDLVRHLHPGWQSVLVDRHHRDLHHPRDLRVRGSHLGDAARGWRLRVDDTHLQQRDRVHHRRCGLVVHPLALDPDLRRHGRPDHGQADLPHPRPQRRGRLAGYPHGHLRRVAGGHRHRLDTRGRGHEDLRQVPEMGHVDRPRGRDHLRHPAARHLRLLLQREVQRRRREVLRRRQRHAQSPEVRDRRVRLLRLRRHRSCHQDRGGRDLPRRVHGGRGGRFGYRHADLDLRRRPELGDLDAHPVHDVLDGMAELGGDAVRRGPRGQGLPQEHLPDARRAPGADVPSPWPSWG